MQLSQVFSFKQSHASADSSINYYLTKKISLEHSTLYITTNFKNYTYPHTRHKTH